MRTRYFAMTMGLVLVVGGLLGFIPGMIQPLPIGAPRLIVNAGYGMLLGLLPTNVLHNLLHIGTGMLGLLAARSCSAARTFTAGLAFGYGLLTLMGVIPVLETAFGLIPMYGTSAWLHAGIALAASYFAADTRSATLDSGAPHHS